jgi:hypothetical protein
MKGVSAVYQMEQEFYPYLVVEFLPNHGDEPGGIILQAGDEIIRKNFTFEKEDDINELRAMLWNYMKKYHKVTNLKDNGRFDWKPTNQVLQGWNEKIRNMKKDVCCKIIREAIVQSYTDQIIKHWVYRTDTTPHINRQRCKSLRFEECDNNYPPESALHHRCRREVEWLCDKGYEAKGEQLTAATKIKDLGKIRKDILDYLLKYNLKVNKQKFDEIISVGLFDDIGNRAGNKSNDLMKLRDDVDRVMWQKDYYTQLVEGFDDTTEAIKNVEGFGGGRYISQFSNSNILILVIFLIIVVCAVWMYCMQ